MEKKLGKYQSEVRKNRSVIDQIFTLKPIMDNNIEQNLPLYIMLIVFKQAYDTAKGQKVYKAITSLVKMTFTDADYK